MVKGESHGIMILNNSFNMSVPKFHLKTDRRALYHKGFCKNYTV